ncbi:hypothetical protein BV22DRAFT_813226 [Leucogyrophana mollusca]|uniref:Uncharacterized protein n=1 Tax=Leucogyrophana mollusca TaxID=85980 RepID=A0ACB8B4U7_9AGAM|nr:hypothetical protein BV22DRAFT_813226 [Leucogyrophana mollusca]
MMAGSSCDSTMSKPGRSSESESPGSGTRFRVHHYRASSPLQRLHQFRLSLLFRVRIESTAYVVREPKRRHLGMKSPRLPFVFSTRTESLEASSSNFRPSVSLLDMGPWDRNRRRALCPPCVQVSAIWRSISSSSGPVLNSGRRRQPDASLFPDHLNTCSFSQLAPVLLRLDRERHISMPSFGPQVHVVVFSLPR